MKATIAHGALITIGLLIGQYILAGACLGLGFWLCRKFTDSIEKRLAVQKLNQIDKDIDCLNSVE